MMEIKLGNICISKKGHDKGKKVVVVAIINEDYVLIVDGVRKNLSLPKMKNIKHLKIVSYSQNLNEKIINKTISDEDVVKIINDFELNGGINV